MTSPLASYDAVVLLSFGGPERQEDVLPFLRNVTRGKDIPDERLAVVGQHYAMFGGRSPINDQNRALLASLRSELDRRDIDVPLVWGNRNWAPYLADTLAELAAGGARRALVVATSAFPSYSGCRQYIEDIAGACPEGLQVDKVLPFGLAPGFLAANLAAVRAGVEELRGEGHPRPHVLFVAHSIPMSMARTSGPEGSPERTGNPGGAYVAQLEQVGDRILAELAEDGGPVLNGDLVFCSRSGPPAVPWLEPDVNDALRDLAGRGVDAVVLAPIGFVSDHMEVVYDLDVEAAATAAELGITVRRTPTAGTHPAFVAGLVDQLEAAAADPVACPAGCCPRPERGRRPVAAGGDPAGSHRHPGY
ncbi:ferrochelatase [Raineyella antarctica]|uniref:Coproporphyrin III ferrochelatase n=1 Tax=Raineyella antarctica TaxID=1577474 RepID=A0A1G6GPX2_9ACTN|nr:ferrochelatase [Raineyella antarctica]SDB84060.1 ferrochelatase [Raineyella antarctica]